MPLAGPSFRRSKQPLFYIGAGHHCHVHIPRHARLKPRQYELVDQAPGTRCLILGGETTKAELRRALRETGRPQLAKCRDSDLSGRTCHQLRACLGHANGGH